MKKIIVVALILFLFCVTCPNPVRADTIVEITQSQWDQIYGMLGTCAGAAGQLISYLSQIDSDITIIYSEVQSIDSQMTALAQIQGDITTIYSNVQSIDSQMTALAQIQDYISNLFVFVVWGTLALLFIMAIAFYFFFRGPHRS